MTKDEMFKEVAERGPLCVKDGQGYIFVAMTYERDENGVAREDYAVVAALGRNDEVTYEFQLTDNDGPWTVLGAVEL